MIDQTRSLGGVILCFSAVYAKDQHPNKLTYSAAVKFCSGAANCTSCDKSVCPSGLILNECGGTSAGFCAYCTGGRGLIFLDGKCSQITPSPQGCHTSNSISVYAVAPILQRQEPGPKNTERYRSFGFAAHGSIPLPLSLSSLPLSLAPSSHLPLFPPLNLSPSLTPSLAPSL
jgi:hypothetical protein